jgi:hypothetical protein
MRWIARLTIHSTSLGERIEHALLLICRHARAVIANREHNLACSQLRFELNARQYHQLEISAIATLDSDFDIYRRYRNQSFERIFRP